MAPSVACPSVEELRSLVDGSRSDDTVSSFASHLESCEACAGRLEELPAFLALVPDIRQGIHAQLHATPVDLGRFQRLIQAGVTLTAPVGEGGTPVVNPVAVSADVTAMLSPPGSGDELGRLGQYRILEILGHGGMGFVFKAEDPRLGRLCAVKAMLPAVASRPGMKERFLREARSAATVEHDHIIPIYHVGEDRGIAYIAMPFLKGLSLDGWLKKHQGESGSPMSVPQILRVGREIALGLAAAHERGLIHRDIKPANIWLDAAAGGRVKILDFGLARAMEPTPAEPIGQLESLLGTPADVAPELIQGTRLDARADLFSLGVVLYQLCTGKLAFEATSTATTLAALVTQEPTPVQQLNAAIPAPLAEMVMQLLEKDREKRPASARAVAETLQGISEAAARKEQRDTVPLALPVPRPEPVRLRWLAVAALLLVGAVVAWQIVIHIKDKNGNNVAELKLAKDVSIEVVNDGKIPDDKPDAGDDDEPSFDGKPLSEWVELLACDKEGYTSGGKQIEAISAIAKESPMKVLAALAGALCDSKRFSTKRFVADSLIRCYGQKAVPAFLRALKDTNGEVRTNAARSLGEIREWRYGKHTYRLTPPVAEEGAEFPVRPENVIPALGEALLKDKNHEVRQAASWSLAQLGKGSIPVLTSALSSPDIEVRKSAVRGFGQLGSQRENAGKAIPVLAGLLKEENEELRMCVLEAVSQLTISAHDLQPTELGQALPALLTVSKSEDQTGRTARSIMTRIKRAPRSTASSLLPFLKDAEPVIRLKAAEVLCEMGEADKECVVALAEVMKQRDPNIRKDAALLLRKYGSAAKDAVPTLVEMLNSVNEDRDPAIEALGAIGPDARAAIPALKGLEKAYQNEVESRQRQIAEMEQSMRKSGQNERTIALSKSSDEQLVTFARAKLQQVRRVLAQIDQ